MMDFLRVLLTNVCLDGRTGTEIVTRNIALALLRQGHQPVVFTLEEGGTIPQDLRQASIPVIIDLDRLREPIDVIHGHHNPTTAIAAARFPDVPAIFVCHDFLAWHDVPPRLANIRRYIAVDKAIEDRLTRQEGIAPDRVQLILNAVDVERFRPGPALPARPARALLFAKQREPVAEVKAACDQLGLSLDVIGPAVENVTSSPEKLMPQYDLVFASAMTALEALACGRPVVVCDGRGLAGMVTRANFDDWRLKNFGRRTLNRPVDRSFLIDEINKYDADDTTALTRRVRNEANVTHQASAYVACYRDVIEEHRRAGIDVGDQFRQLSDHLRTWSPRRGDGWPWMEERARLTEQLEFSRGERKPVQQNDDISFAAGGAAPRHFFAQGFGNPESWGMWTVEESAGLRFEVTEPLLPGSLLELKVIPFVNALHESIAVDVGINGTRVGSRTFHQREGAEAQTWPIRIPKLPASLRIWLNFEIRSPVAPRDIGYGDDARRLGIGLVGLALRPSLPT